MPAPIARHRVNRPSTIAPTRWSQVANLAPDTPGVRQALAWLCQAYWQPLRRAALRRGLDVHDAEDCVQGFLAQIVERGLGTPEAPRGRFRAWVQAAFGHFCANRQREAAALKRGGGAVVALADHDAPVPAPADPAFDRDWAGEVTARAFDRLAREQTEPQRHQVMLPLIRGDNAAEYAAVAQTLSTSSGALRVAVHRARRRLAELIRDEIRETIAFTPAELADPALSAQRIDDELRALLR